MGSGLAREPPDESEAVLGLGSKNDGPRSGPHSPGTPLQDEELPLNTSLALRPTNLVFGLYWPYGSIELRKQYEQTRAVIM